MKRFAAQYVFTGRTAPLKRAIITVHDDGTILDIEKGSGGLREKQSVEFYNGIIVPGFVNCHCHLELSHLKGAVPEGEGLGSFLMNVSRLRAYEQEKILAAAVREDRSMWNEGTGLCADVCNTPVTFSLKKSSRISYISLAEVFGIDPSKTGKRISELIGLINKAEDENIPVYPVPHTAYSVPLRLFRALREISLQNRVTSIHFMESKAETEFLETHSGSLWKAFGERGLLPAELDIPASHVSAVINEVTPAGNLLLVHNTFADSATVREVNKRGNTFWCLCPGSNLYIEKSLPPVQMLMDEGCRIVLGTDSLSSNKRLSMLEEMKIISAGFPSLPFDELLKWATANGAAALGEEGNFGVIEAGKKPGLVLIEDFDLQNMKLLPESTARRLV